MKKPTILYFNASREDAHTIEDEHGQVHSVTQAKKMWEAGQIIDWNLSFERLVHFNFNIEKTYASYQ